MSSEIDVNRFSIDATTNDEHTGVNGGESISECSQEELYQQHDKQENGEHDINGQNEAVNDPVQDPPPVTPPAITSSEMSTSANRRVSTRKRRMAAPACAPSSSSVKRRRITNDGRDITPVFSTPINAKRGRKRIKEQCETPIIDLDDPDDPYNFTANSDVHPEPLKDISIKRTSFGELKFTKSQPGSSERYANVERIAAERNPSLSSNFASPILSTSKSIDSFHLELSLSNSGSQKSGALTSTSRIASNISKKKIENYSEEDNDIIDNFKMEDDVEQMQTPKRRGRKSVASPKTPKNTPQLNLTSNNNLNTPESGKRKPQTAVSSSAGKALGEAVFYVVPHLSPIEQYTVDHPEDLSHFLSPGARVLALWGNEYYGANICGRESLGRYYVLFAEDNLKRILPPSGVFAISFLSQGSQVSFIDNADDEEVGKVAVLEKKPQVIDKNQPDEWVNGIFILRELDELLISTGEIKEVLWSRIFLTKEQAAIILKGRQFNPVPKIDQENIISESRSTRRSRNSRLSYSEFGSASPSPLKTPTSTTKRSDVNVFSATPKTPQKSPKGRVSSTPRGTKINLDNIMEEMPVLEEEVSHIEEVHQNNVEANNLPNKSSPGTRSDSSVNTATPKQNTSPRKSPRTAKKEEAVGAKTDYLETNGEIDKEKINQKDFEDVNESCNSSALETSQRKSSPYDAMLVLSPVQEITESINTSYSSSAGSGIDDYQLFDGLKFVLTSANRPNKVSDFNKREYRTKIEDRKGVVMEDFSTIKEGDRAYLIADTFYRTHKYLCALSLSIPCLSYLWIQECLAKKKLLDHELFLLPAGESTSEPGRICPWKPLKGVLFKGKRVIIYTRFYNEDPNVIPFGEIWVSLMRNLGATVVGIEPGEPFSKEENKTVTLDSKLEFCRKTNFDILLTENDCEPELAGCTSAKNALAVSSEWVIQAMVTGELPSVEASDRFRYDFA